MPAPKNKLYFIAIVPASPLSEELLALKQYFQEHHQSKAALNSPPHITLHMPFEWKEKKEEVLVTKIQEFTSTRNRFNIKLENFGCFKPRVIYVSLIQPLELENLHNELHHFCKTKLNLYNARYKDLPFHPHLTLAFRDLRKSEFHKAWEEFKTKPFSAEFVVNKLALLKHDGHRWDVFHEFDIA